MLITRIHNLDHWLRPRSTWLRVEAPSYRLIKLRTTLFRVFLYLRAPHLHSILVTGATGQVGSHIARDLAADPRYAGLVHTPTRADLDLASPDSVRHYLRDLRPRWIVNPAAYTAVDKAESAPEEAQAINAIAPRILGEEARTLGASVLHFSTDYVFDGSSPRPYREISPTNPVSVYGRTKLAGEQALASTGAHHLILRTSWVYASTGKNFLLTILRLARERDQLTIVADQHGAPTSANELARFATHILTAVEPLPQGIYHATGSGETTWFSFAEEILRLRRLAEPNTRFATVLPIPTSQFPTPARRPVNSRLDCSKLTRDCALQPLPWQEALAAVMAELPQ